MLAAGLTTSVLTSAWAKHIHIQSLEYQSGILNIHSAGRINQPQVEVWPSNSGKETTQVVILSFTDVEADISTLQKKSNEMLLENPELKRFLITPLNHSENKANGLQMVIEVQASAATAESPPAIAIMGDQQLQIILTPSTPLKKSAQDVKAKNIESATYPKQNSFAAPQPRITLPYHPDKSLKQDNAEPLTAIEFQNTAVANTGLPLEPIPQATTDQSPYLPTAATNDGLTTQSMLQLDQLQRELKASKAREEALQIELAHYDDFIRGYLPESTKTSTDATLRNLRVALVKVATKLKATEQALAAQAAKTRELASQLAEVKQDPSVLDDPLLMVQVAEIENEHPSDATPPVLQIKQNQPPKEILERIQFKPAPDRTALLEQAKAKELEISLKTAIRENPENTDAYLKLANLYLERLNLTGAESVLTRMVAQNPTNSLGYYHLAWVYLREKRHLEAKTTLETYKRMKPQDTEGIRLLQEAIRNESGV